MGESGGRGWWTWLAVAWLAIAGVLVMPARAAAETRHALVVGNGAYATAPLPNARNDAEAIARALTSVGFTVARIIDADAATMRAGLAELGRRVRQSGGVALFYFAGHGMQIDGENYLVPVGAEIRQPRDIATAGVALAEVLGAMDGPAGRMGIVVLDACRNNPFTGGERTLGIGLAPPSAPAGTFIAFSTAPGKVALDGEGTHSPYSAALAEMIPTPGLAIEDVFRQTRRRVLASTKGAQTPWEHSSLTQELVFRARAAMPEATARPPATAEPTAAELAELRAWEKIRGTTSVALLRRHLEQWPSGLYAELARHKLDQLAAHASASEGIAGWIGSVFAAPPGDPEAERLFAEAMRADARGTPAAQAEAFEKFRQAAERGLPAALYRVGRAYDKGLGIARDAAAAARWYQQAADVGSVPAMAALGTMREHGEGVAPDLAEALRLYRLAADAGDPWAQTSLAYLFQQGRGVARDLAEARRWYGLAADQGHARALFNLALMHVRSEGGPQDLAAAAGLLRAAVDKGHAGAGRELAYLNDEGRGVPRDRKAAARLLLAAFAAGHKEARIDLLVRPEAWSAEARREVQRVLIAAGHLTGRPTGFFGLETKRALEAWATAQQAAPVATSGERPKS